MMNAKKYSLKPFTTTTLSHQFGITGSISLNSGILVIRYILTGPLAKLVISKPEGFPVRRDNLWEETCFEFFLAPINSERYWEFNLSPAGHWNVYRFESYRFGMQSEPAFQSLPSTVQRRPDALHISLESDLTRIIPLSDHAVTVGISAVMKPISGEMEYWALTHPVEKADFHRRDSFLIKLKF
jgi:hypothetical protein